jgi:hypothetical protein
VNAPLCGVIVPDVEKSGAHALGPCRDAGGGESIMMSSHRKCNNGHGVVGARPEKDLLTRQPSG